MAKKIKFTENTYLDSNNVLCDDNISVQDKLENLDSRLYSIKDYFNTAETNDNGWHRWTLAATRVGMCYKSLTLTLSNEGKEEGLYYSGLITIDLPQNYFSTKPCVVITCERQGGYGCNFVMSTDSTKTQIKGWVYTSLERSNWTVTIHIFAIGV